MPSSRAVAGLERDGARLLVTAAVTNGAYVYQLSRPTGSLRQLYFEEPRWAHDAHRFRAHLTEMLTLVARGATGCKV